MPNAINEMDAPDNLLFNSIFLFKMQIAPNATALEFKHKILETYNKNLKELDPSIPPLEFD